MKKSIYDIIMNQVIDTVTNYIKYYCENECTVKNIDFILNYTYNEDVIEYAIKNGIYIKASRIINGL
jgi:hypothetical protein